MYASVTSCPSFTDVTTCGEVFIRKPGTNVGLPALLTTMVPLKHAWNAFILVFKYKDLPFLHKLGEPKKFGKTW